MTPPRPLDERTGPDQGPLPAAMLAVGPAGLCAIGAATPTAIALAIVGESLPSLSRPRERLRLIDASARFAAEAVGLVVLVIAYRGARGRRAWPRRITLRGLMAAIALVGLIASRFLALLGPWVA